MELPHFSGIWIGEGSNVAQIQISQNHLFLLPVGQRSIAIFPLQGRKGVELLELGYNSTFSRYGWGLVGCFFLHTKLFQPWIILVRICYYFSSLISPNRWPSTSSEIKCIIWYSKIGVSLKKINCMLTRQREPLRTRSQALYLQMNADSDNWAFDKIVSTPQCHIESQNILKHLFAEIMHVPTHLFTELS